MHLGQDLDPRSQFDDLCTHLLQVHLSSTNGFKILHPRSPVLTHEVIENLKLEEVQAEWQRLGQQKMYKCPPGTKLTNPVATKEAAWDGVAIPCGEDGLYSLPAVWPKCRAVRFCEAAAEKPAGGFRTFLNTGEGQTGDGALVEYGCADGSQFYLGTDKTLANSSLPLVTGYTGCRSHPNGMVCGESKTGALKATQF